MWVHLKGLRSICCPTNLTLPLPIESYFAINSYISKESFWKRTLFVLLELLKDGTGSVLIQERRETSTAHEICFYYVASGYCLSTKEEKDWDRN